MESRPETHPLILESKRRQRSMVKQILLCPGPVMLSERVRQALLHGDIGHREKEFSSLLSRARLKLSIIFGVKNPERYTTLVINGSGSAANEAVLSSIDPETRVLVLSNGEFGERLFDLAEIHGLNVVGLGLEWGEPFSLNEIEKAIQEHNPDMIAMVHHETSTGMLNPIKEVGELAREAGKLFFVDAVSSLGAEHVDVEANYIDLCTSSSNKGLAGPCGLSFVCGRRRVFEGLAGVRSRTSYLNLYRHYQMQTEKSQTPNTPSLTILFALDAALDEILEYGLDGRVRHCRRLARLVREGLESLGLRAMVPEHLATNVLTTAYLPDKISYLGLQSRLKERGYVVYGGKGPLENKVFQVANIGAVTENHIHDFIRDLKWSLAILAASGQPVETSEEGNIRTLLPVV